MTRQTLIILVLFAFFFSGRAEELSLPAAFWLYVWNYNTYYRVGGDGWGDETAPVYSYTQGVTDEYNSVVRSGRNIAFLALKQNTAWEWDDDPGEDVPVDHPSLVLDIFSAETMAGHYETPTDSAGDISVFEPRACAVYDDNFFVCSAKANAMKVWKLQSGTLTQVDSYTIPVPEYITASLVAFQGVGASSYLLLTQGVNETYERTTKIWDYYAFFALAGDTTTYMIAQSAKTGHPYVCVRKSGSTWTPDYADQPSHADIMPAGYTVDGMSLNLDYSAVSSGGIHVWHTGTVGGSRAEYLTTISSSGSTTQKDLTAIVSADAYGKSISADTDGCWLSWFVGGTGGGGGDLLFAHMSASDASATFENLNDAVAAALPAPVYTVNEAITLPHAYYHRLESAGKKRTFLCTTASYYERYLFYWDGSTFAIAVNPSKTEYATAQTVRMVTFAD